MTTQEVANRLVNLCRQGKFDAAYQELYAPDIVSIEAAGEPREAKGIDAILQKGQYFAENFEVHKVDVSDPIIAAGHFAVTMKLEATNRKTGEKEPMDEVCVYQVRDGKISQEQFFYPIA